MLHYRRAGAIGWRRSGRRDSAVPMARAPVSQGQDSDWRRRAGGGAIGGGDGGAAAMTERGLGARWV